MTTFRQHSYILELRERILEETILLFKTYGIRSVTMDDIAQQLAISKKTLYRHFKDKKEVVKQAVMSMLAQDQYDMNKIAQTPDVVEEVVKANQHMRRMIRTVHPSMMYDLQKYYPEAWALYDDFKDHIHQNLVSNLKRGITQGVFRDTIKPHILAKMRIEQVQLAFNLQIFPLEEYEVIDVQMVFFDHFVRGLLTLKGLERYEEFLSQADNLN